jgi:glutamate 5-kinase
MATVSALAAARRVVLKIGSALLVDGVTGKLRQEWLAALAEDVVAARKAGVEMILVSSGSIALGRRVLGLAKGPLPLEQSQAAAAVGQIRLARAYEEILAPHGISAAQVLVTLEDSTNRRRYLNSRATLDTLITLGTVPIVNENDTVATDEIRFGDNDRLAAQVAVMAGADLLILLSDVDGLYSSNPKTDPAARHLPVVEKITREIEAMAGDAINEASKGGMKTKLMAAKTATAAGCALVIMEGDVMRPLEALKSGARHTLFRPQGDPQAARKGWISAMKPVGEVHVDAGAAKALASGKSLLPAGVTTVTGTFRRGDAVAIVGPSGETLGKGLAAYEADEARRIARRHSREIEDILGYPGRAALIHRDDMVL